MAVFQDKPTADEPDNKYDNVMEEPSGANRIMPFEFLYLLTNARNRADALLKHKAPENNVTKEKLSEFFDGEERRPDLEWKYPFDIKNNSRRYNPRERLH